MCTACLVSHGAGVLHCFSCSAHHIENIAFLAPIKQCMNFLHMLSVACGSLSAASACFLGIKAKGLRQHHDYQG